MKEMCKYLEHAHMLLQCKVTRALRPCMIILQQNSDKILESNENPCSQL